MKNFKGMETESKTLIATLLMILAFAIAVAVQ